MRSAAQLVWIHIGSPTPSGCVSIEPSVCWICGGATDIAMPRHEFNSETTTDQNVFAAPWATWVCAACVYVRSRITPVPGRPPGLCSKCKGVKADQGDKCAGRGLNRLGGNWRNYTHMWESSSDDPYTNATKGEKPRILSFLRAAKRGTWFAAIADSGQKHVLSLTPVNRPGVRGRVLAS